MASTRIPAQRRPNCRETTASSCDSSRAVWTSSPSMVSTDTPKRAISSCDSHTRRLPFLIASIFTQYSPVSGNSDRPVSVKGHIRLFSP